MWGRIQILLGARLRSGPGGSLPAATWFGHALVGAAFCGLVEDVLPPFAFGVFALGLTAGLIGIPLLGELGWLLRSDPAEEWVATLPVRARELRIARTLHLLILLWALALASLIPAALLAPEETELAGRLALPLLGLGLATFLAAVLLALQSVLGERAEGLLVLVQTLLVVGVVVGLVLGMRHVPALARLPHLGDANAAWLWLFPPAWFAAPLATAEGEPTLSWLPVAVTLSSLVALAAIPAPAHPRAQGRESWLSLFLRPLRGLATRVWVRADERAMFDLVYDALPREREVVLRTYPMIGIPLAFLFAASTEADAGAQGEREGLLALLLFTAGIYLPILLSQIPASASHAARWLHESAPVPEGAVVAGTIKALAVRFLCPLYLLLAWIAWAQAGPVLVLRLALPAAIVSLYVLRILYPVCVQDRPLSRAPDDLRADLDWLGLLGGLAIVLTLVAVLAQRLLTPAAAAGATLVLVVVELWQERRLRARMG